jgi:hypothetical protein
MLIARPDTRKEAIRAITRSIFDCQAGRIPIPQRAITHWVEEQQRRIEQIRQMDKVRAAVL